MPRLSFQNVPTKTGGVISGNISTGAGSPFGKGGQFASQVADIKATIAKAPEGTYDPKFWDQFLELDPEEFPESSLDQFIPSDDPAILSALYDIPTARMAMEKLANMPAHNHRWSQDQRNMVAKQKSQYQNTIALHVNQIMMQKNAPLIQAVKEQQRQKEIDQAVKLAMEQKVRETSTPTPTAPAVITSATSYLPLAVVGIVIVVILLFLRRRA